MLSIFTDIISQHKEYTYISMNLPVNLKILLTGLLKPVNYGKKSVVDNIGPWLLAT
jgi:hypothetical protein